MAGQRGVGTGTTRTPPGVPFRAGVVAVIAVLTVLGSCSPRPKGTAAPDAAGPSSELDLSFGESGRVTTDAAGAFARINDLAVQTDGKIVAAGSDFTLARYARDGSIDPSFGQDGLANGDMRDGEEAYGVAIQSDGKIIVVGNAYARGDSDFALARFHADGALDPSFSEDGLITADNGWTSARAYAVAIQDDGKVVVAGEAFGHGDPNFAIGRYNSDGTPDYSFGRGGWVLSDFGPGYGEAVRAVVVQPDGKILVAGSTAWFGAGSTGSGDFGLARYRGDGTPDATFGTNGLVVTDFAGGTDTATGLALLPDGDIVAVGGARVGERSVFALARYQSDGALAARFGTGGKATTHVGSDSAGASDVEVGPDGKLVVSGPHHGQEVQGAAIARYHPDGQQDRTFGGSGLVTAALPDVGDGVAMIVEGDGSIVIGGGAAEELEERLLLARYDPSGDRDPAFGDDGLVETRVGGGRDLARAVAIQSDERIVAAGSMNGALSVFRYLPDGAIDPSFGKGGFSATQVEGRSSEAAAVAIQADGRILVAGGAWEEHGGEGGVFVLARFHPDGTLDRTFGTNGRLTTEAGEDNPGALALAIQPDGRIIAVGQQSEEGAFLLLRYEPDGRLDRSFGTEGMVVTAFWDGVAQARAVALLSDGRILAAGSADADGRPGGTVFALARYHPDGRLDPTFDGDGLLTTAFGGEAEANAVALLPDGKIVAAGKAIVDGEQFALARYNPDGSLDPTFDGDGLLTTRFPGGDATARSLTILPGNKLVAAGSVGAPGATPGPTPDEAQSDVALARYNPDGSLDQDFGARGRVITDFGGRFDQAFAAALDPAARLIVVGNTHRPRQSPDLALARYRP